MLQILDFTGGNILAGIADDVLDRNDYVKMQPIIHTVISKGQKIKWYFEMKAGTTAALTDYLKKGASALYVSNLHLLHAGDFEKIALVGPAPWKECMLAMTSMFHKAERRYFDTEAREEAVTWIRD